MSLEGICIYNFSPKGFAEDLRALIGEVLKALVGKVNRIFSSRISSSTEKLTKLTPEKIQKKLEKQMAFSQKQIDQINRKEKPPFKYYDFQQHPGTWEECCNKFGFESESKKVGSFEVGICHARGNNPRRQRMEDKHLAIAFGVKIGKTTYPVQLFGIFDGHNGKTAAEFNRDHLQAKLKEALEEFNPHELIEKDIFCALKETFVRLDRDFKKQHSSNQIEGTTSTVAMILDDKLWTANVGDSRTILDNGGTPMQLTEDAKPDDERYKRYIEKNGGWVEGERISRINGVISTARGTGSYGELDKVVNPRPKNTVIYLSELKPGSHLILGCDGIFGEVCTTSDIVDAVHTHQTSTAEDLAKNIVGSALAAGSTDNLSVMVISIKPVEEIAV